MTEYFQIFSDNAGHRLGKLKLYREQYTDNCLYRTKQKNCDREIVSFLMTLPVFLFPACYPTSHGGFCIVLTKCEAHAGFTAIGSRFYLQMITDNDFTGKICFCRRRRETISFLPAN